MTRDELDEWCARIPGLERDVHGDWRAVGIGRISYPGDGLAALAGLEAQSYWFNHRNRVITSVVRRYPPPGTVFDIGGGNGYVSLGLTKAGFSCVMVEPDTTGVAVAKRRNLPTIQAAFETLNIAPASIAGIGLFDVLEHIEDELGTLKRLHDALVPGGMAYIAVPAYSWLWSWNDTHSGHFRRYTRGRLSKVMRHGGFTPVFSTYFFRFLVPPVLLFRALPSLFGAGQENSDDTVRQHALPQSFLGRLAAQSLEIEGASIERARPISFGTSVLIAAKKEAS